MTTAIAHNAELVITQPMITPNRMMELWAEAQKAPRFEVYLQTTALTTNEGGILVFLEYLRNSSPATVEVYLRYLCGCINFSGKDFTRMTVYDVNDYIRSLSDRSQATISTILGALRSFFKRMHGSGLISSNPMALVSSPKKSQVESIATLLTRALSMEGVERCNSYLATEEPIRNALLFAVMTRMGLRAEEICALKWSHFVKVQNKYALDIMGKGRKRRMVVIPIPILELFWGYLQGEFGFTLEELKRNAGAGMELPLAMQTIPIFSQFKNKLVPLTRQGIYTFVTRVTLKVLGRKHSPHDLRHTCFTHMRHLKASLDDIKLAAGHESVATTMRYIDAGKTLGGATEVFNPQQQNHA